MSTGVAVTVTSFGDGRYNVLLPAERATVAGALAASGVEATARRLALNGRRADGGATVETGDQVTVIPHVQAG